MEQMGFTQEELIEEQFNLEKDRINEHIEHLKKRMETNKREGNFSDNATGKDLCGIHFEIMLEVADSLVAGCFDKKKRVKPKYYQFIKEVTDKMDTLRFLEVASYSAVSTIFNCIMLPDSTANYGTSALMWEVANNLEPELIYEMFKADCLQDAKDTKKVSLLASVDEGINKRVQASYKELYLKARITHADYEIPNIDKEGMQLFCGNLITYYVESFKNLPVEKQPFVWSDEPRINKDGKRGENVLALKPSESLLEQINQHEEEWLARQHRECACVIKPVPWTNVFERGGYHFDLQPFTSMIRQDLGAHTSVVKRHKKRLKGADMSNIIAVLNGIQETPYRINKRILKVLEWVREGGQGDIMGIPRIAKPELPPKLPESATEEEIIERKKKCAHIYRDIMPRYRSKRDNFLRLIDTAKKYAKYDNLYFPYNMDYRGRIYPMATDINPQGDDIMKALLEFSQPSSCVSEEAEFWLAIAGANHAAFDGLDKKPFEVRAKWIYDNQNNILASAQDPTGYRWWEEVSKDEHPLEFLSFCFEWSDMLDYKKTHGNNIIGFKCHIPIPFDGSCSGLQHYSAMLRDSVGGKAVNLTDEEDVQDVYSQVATQVTAQLQQHALKGAPEFTDGSDEAIEETKDLAIRWINYNREVGGTDDTPRKVCKRCTMTLVYGSKRAGFVDHILEDTVRPYIQSHGNELHAFSLDQDTNCGFKAANYMAYCIDEALKKTVKMAVGAMKLLQKLATVATKHGHEVTWTTPLGLVVTQTQLKPKTQTVQMQIRGTKIRRRLYVQQVPDELDRNKQRTAIAPNFIHSMDASHLQLVVLACLKEGITNFQLIHDSFATDLANSDRMYHIIREQFVALYEDEHSMIEDFMDRVLIQNQLLDAPNPEDLFDLHNYDSKDKRHIKDIIALWDYINPTGSRKLTDNLLNINEVLKSKYAFA